MKMMMKDMISKQDFKFLFLIDFMNYNDPNLLSDNEISEKEAEDKLNELEKRGLIKIEHREGKIYGSQLTEKGKDIMEDKNYLEWKEEFGY